MRLTEEQMIESRILVAVDKALKEQMEMVFQVIDKRIAYTKFSAENFKQNDIGKACTNAILGILENLKAELEGENG